MLQNNTALFIHIKASNGGWSNSEKPQSRLCTQVYCHAEAALLYFSAVPLNNSLS